MKKCLLASLLMAPLLTGCVVAVGGDGDSHDGNTHWKARHAENRTTIANLESGATYQTILTRMGTPDFSESLSVADKEYQILFYATQSLHSDSKTTKDECTPLVFEQKQLIGWGEAAYSKLK